MTGAVGDSGKGKEEGVLVLDLALKRRY